MSEQTELTSDGEQTAIDVSRDRTGLDINWTDEAEWPYDDYARTPLPDESTRPKPKWDTAERRAYILGLIREHGHPSNVPQSQRDIGEAFGVSQQAISQDFDVLRKYIRFHAGDKAISTTELVAEKAISGAIDDGDWYNAMRAQLEYNEWLFDLGRLERQPRKQQIESVSVSADADDLTEEEEAHLANIGEKLRGANEPDDEDEPIDVESKPVEDEDDE